MLRYLPNFLTLCNGICGYVGILYLTQGRIAEASYALWAGLFFDFFDGFVARGLRVTSEIGKQLDSLCDAVTFGILPSLLTYKLILLNKDSMVHAYSSGIFLVAVLFRLAKFNVTSSHQKRNFIGMPAPAAALAISLVSFLKPCLAYDLPGLIKHPEVLSGLNLLLAYFMCSSFFFLSFKLSTLAWKENRLRYIFLLMAIALVVSFKLTGLFLSLIAYTVLPLFSQLCAKICPSYFKGMD